MADAAARLHAPMPYPSTVLVDQVPRALRIVLHEAAVTPEHLLGLAVWWAAMPAMTVAALVLFGWWAAMTIAVSIAIVPLVFLAGRSGRRSQLIVDSLPEAVDMIGRSLRSGASLHQALSEAADGSGQQVGDELRTILIEIRRGVPAPTALRRWADRVPRQEVRIAAAALAIASAHESGTMQALSGVGQTLRDRAALTAEVRALVSQAVASTRALLFLPVAFIALDALGDQSVLNYLFGQPLGRACLGAGLGLNALGAAWMQLIVRRRLPA